MTLRVMCVYMDLVQALHALCGNHLFLHMLWGFLLCWYTIQEAPSQAYSGAYPSAYFSAYFSAYPSAYPGAYHSAFKL